MSARLALPALRASRVLARPLRAPLLARASSSAPPPVRDPAHPHLYYHPAGGRVALSFLPAAPPPASSTVLGTLPASPDAGLDDFVENPGFRGTMHAAIRDGIERGVDRRLAYEAEMRPGDGYMTLTDERNLPPQGRIGETEDLIASVFVQDGKIVASTYEPLPSYRLVTPNGVLQLPEELDAHVLAYFEKVDAEERAKGGE